MLKFNNQNGVELASWKIDNTEVIYQKNGSWTKQDPFLFPNIGNSAQPWRLNEQNVKLPKHGMFVNSDIKFINYAFGQFLYMQKHHEWYNYKFDCNKSYIEFDNQLEIATDIINLDKVKIPFQVGFHLAFKVTNKTKIHFTQDKYQLNTVDLNSGFVSEEKQSITFEHPWTIDFELFKTRDSLIFANNQIKNLILENDNYQLEFEFSANFSIVTLWTCSNSNDENKFICIEPWSNLPTTMTKLNQTIIEPNEEITFSYKIKYRKK